MAQSSYLSKKHKLLFQASFLEKEEALIALNEWKKHYQRSDLDWTTRSILPLLVQRLPKNMTDFDRYRSYYQQTWLLNLVKLARLKKILNDLANADVPVCLLKGTTMLVYYYKNMGMRPGMSDVDLLIQKSALPRAMKVLESHGMVPSSVYRHTGPEFRNLISKRDSCVLKYHHAINYNILDMNIDLHWRVSPYIKSSSFDNLRERMQVIPLGEKFVYMLSPEEHFIHTCFHGIAQISSHCKLWWVIDILYLLANKKDLFDWESVFKLSQSYKVDAYVMHALIVISEINIKLSPDTLLMRYQESLITKFRCIQFSLHHHKIKFVKQFCCYYYLFCSNQSSKLNYFNPILFVRFIKSYFGFSSLKEIGLRYLR